MRAQNGKFENPAVPRGTRNLHDYVNLNNNFQLDGVQRVRDAQVNQNSHDHCKRSYFECYDQFINNSKVTFH